MLIYSEGDTWGGRRIFVGGGGLIEPGRINGRLYTGRLDRVAVPPETLIRPDRASRVMQ